MAPRTRRTTNRRPVARAHATAARTAGPMRFGTYPTTSSRKRLSGSVTSRRPRTSKKPIRTKSMRSQKTPRDAQRSISSPSAFSSPTSQPAIRLSNSVRLEPPPNKGGGDQCDEPSDDQDGERQHELTEVCGDQFLGVRSRSVASSPSFSARLIRGSGSPTRPNRLRHERPVDPFRNLNMSDFPEFLRQEYTRTKENAESIGAPRRDLSSLTDQAETWCMWTSRCG